MRVLRELSAAAGGARPAAVTIGSFDGIHLGHQRLLARTVAEARRLGGEAALVTFEPHPRCVVDPGGCPPLLTALDERLELIAAAGIDTSVVLAFTRELSQWSAGRFVAALCGGFALRRLVTGPGFALGRGRAGTIEYLRGEGSQRGFRVVTVAAARQGGARVSSGRVRAALADGRLGEANRLLGRPYCVAGTVGTGSQIGRRLGFPTANIAVDPARCLPATGVYATWFELASRRLPAASSVGYRPTFGGGTLTVEAHVLDYSADLYGQQARLWFLRRLRAERMFSSERALARQMARDVDRVRALLRGVAAA
jgi:riboflavin kinase/FMN adenylyltransferase